MLGTFPKVFPKRHIPKGIFPSVNFPMEEKRQLPKCTFKKNKKQERPSALGPLAHPSLGRINLTVNNNKDRLIHFYPLKNGYTLGRYMFLP